MRTLIIALGALAVTGCAQELPASRLEVSALPVPSICTKITGSSLGALPLAVEVGGRAVRLAEWTSGDAVSREVYGFAAQLPEGVSFMIDAGDEIFTSTQSRWLHPRAFAGGHAIDAVTFCATATLPALATR
jgi:hypothetical protein